MKNKILIYDDNCPLCTWYSSLFVSLGLLPTEGRIPFSTLEPPLIDFIDLDKSRNEIPLLDTQSGKVWYGIDALLEILGQSAGFIKTTGKIKPINWFLKKLYKFISYNRNVIVAKKCSTGSLDCSPDMDYKYRIVFMIVFLVFNSLMLFPLHPVVFSSAFDSLISTKQLQLAHFGLVLINCLLALNFNKLKAIEYLGQINMLALITVLLLLPLLLVHYFISPIVWFSFIYMGATAIIIFKEYLRRMEYIGVLTNNKWIAAINLAGMVGFILFLCR
ncbi:MAG: DCC1-like thiol-disulfide oxidoreductase family protein [Chitinophagaceae bacterium]